jgi:hypothetical protein
MVQVKLLKCLVDNIVVDISFNQMGGLITLNFLEEINNLIGNSNIFKRSIILVRQTQQPLGCPGYPPAPEQLQRRLCGSTACQRRAATWTPGCEHMRRERMPLYGFGLLGGPTQRLLLLLVSLCR